PKVHRGHARTLRADRLRDTGEDEPAGVFRADVLDRSESQTLLEEDREADQKLGHPARGLIGQLGSLRLLQDESKRFAWCAVPRSKRLRCLGRGRSPSARANRLPHVGTSNPGLGRTPGCSRTAGVFPSTPVDYTSGIRLSTAVE